MPAPQVRPYDFAVSCHARLSSNRIPSSCTRRGRMASFLYKPQNLREDLAKKMTPDQVEEAERLAWEWKPKQE